MKDITDLPLGDKFYRQSRELSAIRAKLKRPKISAGHRDALMAHERILESAMERTQESISVDYSTLSRDAASLTGMVFAVV